MRHPWSSFSPAAAGLLALLAGGSGSLEAAPANDNFAGRAALTGASGQARGTNSGATRESGEPDHAGNRASHSVWWKWVAPSDGTARIDTSGSAFDTILSVYRGTSLNTLVSLVENDGGALGSECVVVLPVVNGHEYEVCVDGFEGATGAIVLNWTLTPPCASPAAAGPPDPADGATGVSTSVDLRWTSAAALRAPRKIYGNDDRLDIYQVTDPSLVKLWESTVALVQRSELQNNGDGTFSLPADSLSAVEGVCPSERFANQPAPAFCSGFLVGEDLVATAGHCVTNSSDCASVAFVFGFRMLDATTPVLTIPADQIYHCAGIVGSYHPDNLADFAIIRLDRKVPDHDPLPVRRTGEIPDAQSLFIIGHPLGLPAKLAAGAFVRDNSSVDNFVTNLDAFGGNSGSAVFNATTRIVEGILVAGDPVDLVQSGNCLVSSHCSDTGCLGEEVTRSTQFADLVPPNPRSLVYQVFLGPCGNLVHLGDTAEGSWSAEGLQPGTAYCWKVVTKDDCGETEGPTWTFTTAPASPLFRRGDATPDGSVDLTDAVGILAYLFQGQSIACLEAADVDDNGAVDVTDAITLLDYLFIGGAAPPAPYPGCGADATPDALGCSGYAPCGSTVLK